MKTIIDKKELTNSYPLIERTISADDYSVIVDFELIGALDYLKQLLNESSKEGKR